jgi:hypothetical protein
VNKKVQTALKSLKTKYGLISLEELNDENTTKKTGEAINISKSEAKIRRENNEIRVP